jgi:hypothetical protein
MSDEEYFYDMCDKMSKLPTDVQLERFLKEMNTSIRIKAFIVAMGL